MVIKSIVNIFKQQELLKLSSASVDTRNCVTKNKRMSSKNFRFNIRNDKQVLA